MEFSYDWIRQYVDGEVAPDQMAGRLTGAGLAVEGQTPRGDDIVFDIDVTTNRPDCMNHFGLAREVSTLFGQALVAPISQTSDITAMVEDAATVEVEDSQGCPRYVARVVRGVQVGPSPDWLVQRLQAIGQRPINNIVDITNFVLWELGQPIHAFDLDKLGGSTIIVRRAREDEVLTTLDGENRKLDEEVLVIADADRAVALAGIMGGFETEVSEATTNVLIESAHFDPTRIRLGAGRLGMNTDASHRFERGADPEMSRVAADRVARLIAEIAGGEVLAGAIDVRSPTADWRLHGRLELRRLERFGGIELDSDQVEKWLAGVGFELEPDGDGAWRIEVPSWRYYDQRPDPTGASGEAQGEVYEADLFEEVLRLHGFDDIPATLPSVGGPDAGSSAGHWHREKIRQHLAACGYLEAITFAFYDRAAATRFPAIAEAGDSLGLANPLSDLYTVMRRSLLPGLVAAAEFNQRRGAGTVRLFEIGHIFPGDQGAELEAAALVAGGGAGSPWNRHSDYDLFDLKGAVESLDSMFAADLEFRPANVAGFVAGTSSEIVTADQEVVGFLGQLDHEESPYPLFATELSTTQLGTSRVPRLKLPSKFPSIGVDLTLTHALEVPWAQIADEIEAAAVDVLISFELKDRYSGEGVPAGAVNTTIAFLYNAEDRSLTQEEVNERHDAIRRLLDDRFGWKGSS